MQPSLVMPTCRRKVQVRRLAAIVAGCFALGFKGGDSFVGTPPLLEGRSTSLRAEASAADIADRAFLSDDVDSGIDVAEPAAYDWRANDDKKKEWSKDRGSMDAMPSQMSPMEVSRELDRRMKEKMENKEVNTDFVFNVLGLSLVAFGICLVIYYFAFAFLPDNEETLWGRGRTSYVDTCGSAANQIKQVVIPWGTPCVQPLGESVRDEQEALRNSLSASNQIYSQQLLQTKEQEIG